METKIKILFVLAVVCTYMTSICLGKTELLTEFSTINNFSYNKISLADQKIFN